MGKHEGDEDEHVTLVVLYIQQASKTRVDSVHGEEMHAHSSLVSALGLCHTYTMIQPFISFPVGCRWMLRKLGAGILRSCTSGCKQEAGRVRGFALANNGSHVQRLDRGVRWKLSSRRFTLPLF